MSTSPANIDWAAVRAKMTTEETRADADRARDAFVKRLNAAESVRAAAPIDWASYKKALPELDVDAIKADFEKADATIPAVVYDESADRKAQEAKEASWNAFATYCSSRVVELQKLQVEQSANKLNQWYRRRQLYARFPGLYETLHNKVRGEWDVETWGKYLAYRAKSTPLPWDPSVGDVDAARRKEIMASIAASAGVTPQALFGKAA
jgi:hypothetical protein